MGPSAEAATDREAAQSGRVMGAGGAISQMLLFAGAVRATPLLRAARRNVLDLPLTAEQTLGQRWAELLEAACESRDERIGLGVLIDRNSPKPASLASAEATLEPDDVAFLGTGGVLRAAAKGREGLMLVATGGSLLTQPLAAVIDRLLALEADVALLAEHDGTPTGVMLVRASVLREMPGAGYMDFKEQCLPKIAERHRVRVAFADAGSRVCLPVRDREQYLEALDWMHGGRPFVISERGSEVSASARLRSAVVLSGARVGRDAIVARSVLGPDASVGAGQVVADASLGAGA